MYIIKKGKNDVEIQYMTDNVWITGAKERRIEKKDKLACMVF